MSIEENGYTNGENEEGASREDSTAEHSFDELARGVSTGTVPRRKALRMLAASLFGGVLVAAPAMAAPRDNRKPGGTGCPKAGQIRNEVGKCECQSQLVTCGPTGNESCVDPNTCGNGQRVNTTSCKCECINANETLCPGTGTCISNACPEGAVLETSGESCECQCRNSAKEIVGTQCVCKTDITCAGEGEVINPDTCACECPPATIRCGGNCVAECLEGFVLKNCECVAEVTCLDICTDGCCEQGDCVGGNSNTACGSGGTTCTDCTQTANTKVCVNGVCRECAANADCGANQQCVNNVCQNVVTPVTCPTGRCSGGQNPVNCGTVAGCVCQGSGSNSTCGRPA